MLWKCADSAVKMCDLLSFVTPPRNLSGHAPSETSLLKGPRPKKRLPEGSYHERDYTLDGCSFLAGWHKYVDDDNISFDIVRQERKIRRKPLRSTKGFENSMIRRRLFQHEVAAKTFSPDEGCYSDEDNSSSEGSLQKPSRKASALNSYSRPTTLFRSSDSSIPPEAKASANSSYQARPKQLVNQFSGANRLSNKTCSSCGTRKTPLWRDSEDGTPYCNACGIRYRKYKTSCGVCKYVPRKEACSSGLCCKCGGALIKC